MDIDGRKWTYHNSGDELQYDRYVYADSFRQSASLRSKKRVDYLFRRNQDLLKPHRK